MPNGNQRRDIFTFLRGGTGAAQELGRQRVGAEQIKRQEEAQQFAQQRQLIAEAFQESQAAEQTRRFEENLEFRERGQSQAKIIADREAIEAASREVTGVLGVSPADPRHREATAKVLKTRGISPKGFEFGPEERLKGGDQAVLPSKPVLGGAKPSASFSLPRDFVADPPSQQAVILWRNVAESQREEDLNAFEQHITANIGAFTSENAEKWLDSLDEMKRAFGREAVTLQGPLGQIALWGKRIGIGAAETALLTAVGGPIAKGGLRLLKVIDKTPGLRIHAPALIKKYLASASRGLGVGQRTTIGRDIARLKGGVIPKRLPAGDIKALRAIDPKLVEGIKPVKGLLPPARGTDIPLPGRPGVGEFPGGILRPTSQAPGAGGDIFARIIGAGALGAATLGGEAEAIAGQIEGLTPGSALAQAGQPTGLGPLFETQITPQPVQFSEGQAKSLGNAASRLVGTNATAPQLESARRAMETSFEKNPTDWDVEEYNQIYGQLGFQQLEQLIGLG